MSLAEEAKAFAATVGGPPVTPSVWLVTVLFGVLTVLTPPPCFQGTYAKTTVVLAALTWLRTVEPRVRPVGQLTRARTRGR